MLCCERSSLRIVVAPVGIRDAVRTRSESARYACMCMRVCACVLNAVRSRTGRQNSDGSPRAVDENGTRVARFESHRFRYYQHRLTACTLTRGRRPSWVSTAQMRCAACEVVCHVLCCVSYDCACVIVNTNPPPSNLTGVALVHTEFQRRRQSGWHAR
jgi:hypothetical protein